jgi:hypothetical protein
MKLIIVVILHSPFFLAGMLYEFVALSFCAGRDTMTSLLSDIKL